MVRRDNRRRRIAVAENKETLDTVAGQEEAGVDTNLHASQSGIWEQRVAKACQGVGCTHDADCEQRVPRKCLPVEMAVFADFPEHEIAVAGVVKQHRNNAGEKNGKEQAPGGLGFHQAVVEESEKPDVESE